MKNQKTQRINEIEAELYTEANEESRRDVTNPERAMAKIIDVKNKKEVEVCKDDVLGIYEDSIKLTFEIILDTGEETEIIVKFPEDDIDNVEKVKKWCEVSSLSGLIDRKVPVKKENETYRFAGDEYKETLTKVDKVGWAIIGSFAGFLMTIPTLFIIISLLELSLIGGIIGYLIVFIIFAFNNTSCLLEETYEQKVEPWEDVGFESDI